MNKYNIGEKVTYNNGFKKEHGIVKSISDDKHVFVVYHCGGEWDKFQDYTAARTKNDDLLRGWL